MPHKKLPIPRLPYGAFRPWIAVLMVVFGAAGLGIFAWFGALQ